MIAALALLVTLVGEAEFVETRLELGAEVLGYECVDVDLDHRVDVVVVAQSGADRVLQLFRQDAGGGFPARPDWRLTVPRDVFAHAFLDLRAEPGQEVLLLTRGGVHSLSTTNPGLRDNLRRELELPLFPDLADAGALPRWNWITDLDGDGRLDLLLPSGGALVAFAASSAGANGAAPGLTRGASLPCIVREELASFTTLALARNGGAELDVRVPGFFPRAPSSVPLLGNRHMFRRSEEWDLPALVDADGDGRQDAVYAGTDGLLVRRQDAGGGFAAAERHVVPAVLQSGARPRLVDVDGDGRREVLLVQEGEGGLQRDFVVTVAPWEDGTIGEEAVARIKLSAANVDFDLVDVDRDGRLDLTARVVDLPTGIQTLTAIHVDNSLLVFRGAAGGGFSRRPDLRFERRLRPNELERIRETLILDIRGDYDGDGLNDLLLLRPDGLLQILPVHRDGSSLVVADEPRSSHVPAKPVRSARPEVLSLDPVSDLVLRHEDALTILVSRRSGGG